MAAEQGRGCPQAVRPRGSSSGICQGRTRSRAWRLRPPPCRFFFRGGGGTWRANGVFLPALEGTPVEWQTEWCGHSRAASLHLSVLTLVPSFRMDSSAARTVVQNERTVRLVDSRIELSTRRSQHAAQLLLCR